MQRFMSWYARSTGQCYAEVKYEKGNALVVAPAAAHRDALDRDFHSNDQETREHNIPLRIP